MSDVAANSHSSWHAPSRRRFLQGGVALGAALATGVEYPTAGQAQPAPDDPSKVLGGPLRPYGERSRFEQTVREKPPGAPDEFGGIFTPLDETLGIITPSALHLWSNAVVCPRSTRVSIASSSMVWSIVRWS